MVRIDPAGVLTNGITPPARLDRVLANGKEFAVQKNIVVPPGRGHLEFDFNALSFTAPEKIQFRYRLDGVDRDWIDSGGRRQAVYTNLKPGRYGFHVVAANSDGEWNPRGASVQIELRPHFQQTAAFYLLCGGLGLGVLGGVYLLRVRHLESKQRALQRNRDELETEVRQRMAELARSLSVLNAALESTADGLLVIDQQERVVTYNRKFIEMWRIPPDKIACGKEANVLPQALLLAKDEAAVRARVRELYRRPDAESFDVIELKDERIIEYHSVPQRLEGEIVGRVWSFRDVTEQRRVQCQIIESRNFLDQIINSISDPVFVKDQQHRGVLVNDAFCDLMGCKREALLGKSDDDHVCYSEGEASTFKSQDQIVLDTGRQSVSAESLTSADGRVHHLITKKTAYVDEKGARFVVGVARDVTKEKTIERELIESRNFLDRIINSISDPIYVTDRQHRWVLVNEAGCIFVGAPRLEILGKTARELFPGLDLDAVWTKEELVFETGRESIIEENFADPTGNQRTIVSKKNLYVDDKGERFIVAVIQEITERKKAETELRWKTAFLEALLASSIDGVLVVDDHGRKVFQNQRVLDLWKIPREIAADPDDSKQVQHIMKRVKDPQEFADKVQRLYSHPNEISHEEIEFIDGTILDRDTYPVVGQEGTRYGRIWQFRDVTQRKRAEAELAYERDLLRALLDSTSDAIYFKDLQSRFLRGSRSMARRFKLGKIEELVGKTDFDLFTEEHARQAFEDEQKIIRTGEPLLAKIEKETRPDGSVTWALSSKMPLRNVNGEIIGTLGISKDITPIKDAEAKLNAAHRQLLEVSRQAGMAEVATSVLHNVGNVLNSINVSVTLVADAVKRSRVTHVERLSALVQEHRDDLAGFFATNPKGKLVPGYLANLAAHLVQEQARLLKEIGEMGKNIEHIKDIVMMQQSYAKVSGVTEKVNVVDLVEDALRMNSASLIRHNAEVIRDYVSDAPEITVERHKVLQILVNLVRNAKYACDESGRSDKRITVQIRNGDNCVRISVADNGVGIPPQNMTRIFNHGFTTRKDGHGFGLHSGALAAREMGGTLSAQSDGLGKGALFNLELPMQPPTFDKQSAS